MVARCNRHGPESVTWDGTHGLPIRRAHEGAATVISGALLGVTGFRDGLGGQAMSGWWMWTHMATAPLFLVGLTALALLGAERFRFGPDTIPAQWIHKVSFWLVLTLGLVTLVSIQISMLSTIPHEQQAWFHGLHRYASLAFLAALVVHLGAALLPRPKKT